MPRRAWSRLTLAPRTRKGRVTFAATLEEAVRGATSSRRARPRTRTSSVGCSPTSMAMPGRCHRRLVDLGAAADAVAGGDGRPERLVVGHPFNPVYLLPLVEVCGGERTSPRRRRARRSAFYAGLGMRPLRIRKEIDGFVADRLLEALWREALWLVHDDVATTEEVDDAIRYGAGLRWAQMGTFLVYRIAGGEAGFRHFMAQFGPALKWPWTKLMDVPELTEGSSISWPAIGRAGRRRCRSRELERKRDDNLVAILQALRAEDYAAGAVLKAHEARLFDGCTRRRQRTTIDESRPLPTYRDERAMRSGSTTTAT